MNKYDTKSISIKRKNMEKLKIKEKTIMTNRVSLEAIYISNCLENKIIVNMLKSKKKDSDKT